MKIKTIFVSALAGVVAAILCYVVFISPATFAALAIRHKMPGAWFASSIVWYATGVVVIASIAAASIVYWIVYKQAKVLLRGSDTESKGAG